MADIIILILIGALIGFIVYYLVKQRQNHSGDACAGCAENKKSCSKCDVETLKKELKAQVHK
jgi:hypothetical protein